MAQSGAKRRLTTILAADVEGYSRLMRADEEATLATLTTYREIIDGLIARHDGRIFGTGGDSVLAEFGSAVEAVRAAISIQEELKVRNAELAEAHQMNFRIGVTVGDVMVKGDNLFGDGVNVAARLEGLAEPGGICISGSAFEQVKNKLTIGFKDIGLQEVKNIDEPVPAFRLVLGADAAPEKPPTSTRSRRVQAVAAAAAIVVLLAGGGYWLQDNWWRFQTVDAASLERMAYALPDKPSIAVLPFVNLSGNPDDEFLPDGISEDITTSLAKLPSLFVISRTTTATYKDKDLTVKQVAEELGVRYVLEGSVQRQGERMRVTAQLIDALSGAHVWADRYDRDMTDLFAVKDEITLNVVSNVGAELETGEFDRTLRSETDSLEAWLLVREGTVLLLRIRREDNLLARDRFERAIAIDPGFLTAHAQLGNTYRQEARAGWTDAPEEARAKALEILNQVLEKDPTHAFTYSILAVLYRDRRQSDLALEAATKAVELDPNNYMSHGVLAMALSNVGRPSEAIPEVKAAMRLSPVHPDWIRATLSNAYLRSGDLDQALKSLEAHLARPPTSPMFEANVRSHLALVYDAMGREQEARDQVARAVEVYPRTSISHWTLRIPQKEPSTMDGWAETWRRLGMPE